MMVNVSIPVATGDRLVVDNPLYVINPTTASLTRAKSATANMGDCLPSQNTCSILAQKTYQNQVTPGKAVSLRIVEE